MRWFLAGAGLSLSLWALAARGSVLAASPEGSAALLEVADVALMMSFFACLGAVPLGFVGLVLRPSRIPATPILAVCVFHAVASLALGRQVHALRLRSFLPAVARGESLVVAIRGYQGRVGHAPGSLSDLVPRFLPEVPGTGMGGYPRFEYSPGDRPADDGEWGLRVSVGSGLMNRGRLEYRPSLRYPPDATRIGDWALVRED